MLATGNWQFGVNGDNSQNAVLSRKQSPDEFAAAAAAAAAAARSGRDGTAARPGLS
jgi:hypothetical protein